MSALEKIKLWATPLTLGQFDYFPQSRRGLSNDAYLRCLPLTLGQFWAMPDGGHYLRRQPGADIPTAGDPICGVSIGANPEIQTVAGFGPGPANSRAVYSLTSFGGGGVEEPATRAIREVVVIDPADTLANPIPNAAIMLTVKQNADGSFRLGWRYRAKDQPIAPVEFAVFAGVGAVDFTAAIATVPYKAGSESYDYTTGIISGSDVEPWQFAVRARVSATRSEMNDAPGPIIPATTDAPYDTVPTVGVVQSDTSPVFPG